MLPHDGRNIKRCVYGTKTRPRRTARWGNGLETISVSRRYIYIYIYKGRVKPKKSRGMIKPCQLVILLFSMSFDTTCSPNSTGMSN